MDLIYLLICDVCVFVYLFICLFASLARFSYRFLSSSGDTLYTYDAKVVHQGCRVVLPPFGGETTLVQSAKAGRAELRPRAARYAPRSRPRAHLPIERSPLPPPPPPPPLRRIAVQGPALISHVAYRRSWPRLGARSHVRCRPLPPSTSFDRCRAAGDRGTTPTLGRITERGKSSIADGDGGGGSGSVGGRAIVSAG